MGWQIAVAALTTAASAYFGKRGSDKAGDSIALQREQLDFYKSIWADYKTTYGDLEASLVQDATRGLLATRYADKAQGDTASAFGRSREMGQRRLSRYGLNPASGRRESIVHQSELDEAKTIAGNRTRAREWVKDTNFNRKVSTVASARGLYMPLATGGMNSAYGGMASSMQGQADAYGQAAGALGEAGAMLIPRGTTNSPTTTSGSGSGIQYTPPRSKDVQDFMDYQPRQFNDGGLVQRGLNPRIIEGESRVVDGPPGVDQVPAVIDGQEPAKLTTGEMVIPADVVMRKGTEFFDNTINSARGLTKRGGQ